ncbi:hypothetical protein QYH69_32170 [Paraburkholderia sp. SARCC-3016]|uniref:hypothetical protein n=1 Tax=Paraburkholderia sp. SARCC-3016 TaxID=3058611 RepID=UPI0028089AAE|nr:hypothetical protein [Paraburkholderia sp. SARCC-3016]MDQ7981880.1 hypothetical protein [Paraburkholderia sp. SARCC-3016]
MSAPARTFGGIARKGSEIKTAKLREVDVVEIKRQLSLAPVDDGTAARLARAFNVSESTIASIKAGRTWGWLEVRKPIDLRQTDMFSEQGQEE